MTTSVIANSDVLNNDFQKRIFEIYSSLELLEDEYPDFKNWFFNTVVPEIGKSRSLILKSYGNEIVGLSILKSNPLEKKICTLRVIEKFQRFGIGDILLKESCRILNTSKPLITVSHKRINQFSKLLYRNNFSLQATYPNCYINGVSEYAFNGGLDKKTEVKNSGMILEMDRLTKIESI